MHFELKLEHRILVKPIYFLKKKKLLWKKPRLVVDPLVFSLPAIYLCCASSTKTPIVSHGPG